MWRAGRGCCTTAQRLTPAELREFIGEELASFQGAKAHHGRRSIAEGHHRQGGRRQGASARRLREKPQRGAASEQGLNDSLFELFKPAWPEDERYIFPRMTTSSRRVATAFSRWTSSLELQKMIGKELPESILFEGADDPRSCETASGRKSREGHHPADGPRTGRASDRCSFSGLSDQGYEVVLPGPRPRHAAKPAGEFAISSANVKTSRSSAATSPNPDCGISDLDRETARRGASSASCIARHRSISTIRTRRRSPTWRDCCTFSS